MKITDRMIAETVMELDVRPFCGLASGPENRGHRKCKGIDCPDHEFPFRGLICIHNNGRPYIKEYTTDISQAFQVVDRMRELGWKMFNLHYNPLLETYTAKFESWKEDFVDIVGRAMETNPEMAICQAAYKAKVAK